VLRHIDGKFRIEVGLLLERFFGKHKARSVAQRQGDEACAGCVNAALPGASPDG
jgi:hypothetical protein